MKNTTWLNLPIEEVKRSKEFFQKLGASFVENETETMFGIYLGENNIQVMMFIHPEFEQFTQAEVTDTSTSAEMLISMEATSKEEVDEMAAKVQEAGGQVQGPDLWGGWMYGILFQDLDGHRWNMAYMDWDKMPK